MLLHLNQYLSDLVNLLTLGCSLRWRASSLNSIDFKYSYTVHCSFRTWLIMLLKHKMKIISANNKALQFKFGTRTVSTWCIFWCCYGNTLGSSRFPLWIKIMLPFVSPYIGRNTSHSIPHNVHTTLDLPMTLLKTVEVWNGSKTGIDCRFCIKEIWNRGYCHSNIKLSTVWCILYVIIMVPSFNYIALVFIEISLFVFLHHTVTTNNIISYLICIIQKQKISISWTAKDNRKRKTSFSPIWKPFK